jgi:hypothetical protein
MQNSNQQFVNSGSGYCNTTSDNRAFTGTSANFNMWSDPVRIDVIEKSDCIEFIYKEYANIITSHPTICYTTILGEQSRVFKIVFSCAGGTWNKSERIYGRIVAAKEETYEF